MKFYFPGAGIDVKMTINLAEDVEKAEEAKGPVMVSLNDFFNL